VRDEKFGGYTRSVNAPKPSHRRIFLSFMALLAGALSVSTFGATSTGRFEVYCDGVGFFLSNIPGAPAPGRLVLFSWASSPPGSLVGIYLSGKWSDVIVYRDGCIPDGKCEVFARGRMWVDAWDTSEKSNLPPKRISGKYEVNLKGKILQGSFEAKEHIRKNPFRVCM
jgi:hypothetical protein